MNPNDTIDDIKWQMLIQAVGEQFNDLTIKRGFQYFKQGFVHPVKTTNAGHIEAIVEGSDTYRVELDLDTLSASRCSCPVPSHCKHVIAVLLDYVSRQGRFVHAIVNAHSTIKMMQSAKTPSSEAPVVERRGEAVTALQEKAAQIPEMSIAEWHGLFKLCITPLEFRSPNAEYAKNAMASIEELKPNLTPAMERLFDLHAHLFMLIKLLKPAQQSLRSSHSYIGYHTQVATDELQEGMKQIFEKGLDLGAEPELWPRVIKTLTYLRRQMLTEPKSFSYLFEAYDQLWLHWLQPNLAETEMYSEELQKLQSAEEDLGDTLSRLPWMLAQSRICFLMGEDKQSWGWLEAADKAAIIPQGYLISFLEALTAAEEWPRLQEWLVHISPMLSSHRKGHWHDYMEYWTKTVQHYPESEERMWNTLVSMLPHSKDIYEETLLSYGKWQQWMDIQLSTGKEPLEFRVSVLQPIEKNAPEMLLPFYHQAVERHVLLKNRSSYKAAVKLLKRLSKLYAKMKQEERWEHFITAFTSRHSRLRALQEELRKGKLIS